jgi:glycosyltransferase involved in cell wall biosynthesis
MPAPLRSRIVAGLVDSGARLQFVAQTLLRALSASVGTELRRALADVSFVEPCPLSLPPLDERERLAARRRLAGAPALVVCGRLIADKRVHLAMEAAALVGARLWVVGDGPEAGRLRRQPSAGGAIFTGKLSRGEALATIAAADALVSCSRAEAAPTAVREARALGVPVVATAAGDLPLWAATDRGIVIVEPTAEALARALSHRLHLTVDSTEP